jgi:hypothetical protein
MYKQLLEKLMDDLSFLNKPIPEKCDACGSPMGTKDGTSNGCEFTDQARNGFDNGLCLSGFLGYYGGFVDKYYVVADGTEGQNVIQDQAYFCHDCCLKLFTVFPYLGHSMNILPHEGCHSMHKDQDSTFPCCDYAWTMSEDSSGTVYIARDGSWIDPHK